MIGYKAVSRFNLFFDKWWYTNIFPNFYIQVLNTFIIIGLIAESTLKLINGTRSKIFANPIFAMKAVSLAGLIFKHYL